MWTTTNMHLTNLLLWLQQRLGPVDERGGGRNTDEGFHISGSTPVTLARGGIRSRTN